MTFEVIKRANGSFGWQLRDEHGEIVERPAPGHVDLPFDPAAVERSRRAWQEVLRQDFEEQQRTRPR